MTRGLSPNTQAILLLTAPLIAGRGTSSSSDLLSPGEYKRLARHLRDIQRQPADLLSPDAQSLLKDCQPVMDAHRLQQLLERGFLLSQVIERWQARAIWVLSRADAEYPRRLKHRLREDAPAVLYGCGDISLLETGGLAVIGSRNVDDDLIDYTLSIGRMVARAGYGLVSGGAKGIDQAAMRGALEAGGKATGVLADSLEKASMNREHRRLLLDGQLVLVSPYDPGAGFNVGHAMQRNKLIYALADASLVVSSDVNKGGTWAGAVEQLEKLKLVPVYVRSTGHPSEGLEALRSKGAVPWPNPQEPDALDGVFDVTRQTQNLPLQPSLELINERVPDGHSTDSPIEQNTPAVSNAISQSLASASPFLPGIADPANDLTMTTCNPSEKLFSAVRSVIQTLLKIPMKETEIAAALNVSNSQTKVWLLRLAEEGVIEKQKKSAGYRIKQSKLFE